jgi:hypothetical protein
MTAILSPLASPNSIHSTGAGGFAHSVSYPDVAADFQSLIDDAIKAIADGEAAADEILGGFVQLASLVRAVSFREGKLLELAMIRIAQAHPDLTVLWQSIKLPIVPAAVEAIAGNAWQHLEGIKFDADARTRQSYTPDLIIINRARHAATILDLKRSLASYGDTNRLSELRCKMLAAAMVLPDWLYKTQKRMMVDSVDVAIVDGASRPRDPDQGFWGLADIDELLEINGAADCMAELRRQFGLRVQALLESETRKALASLTPHKAPKPARPVSAEASDQTSVARIVDQDGASDNLITDDRLPVRVRIGFARRFASAR